ncbi:oxidoreductase [Sphingomonas sp. DBB INV C78]
MTSRKMQISFHGLTALVTGSTRGIGYAIARKLAQGGASVIVNGRTQDAVDSALVKLRADVEDGDFRGVAADIAAADGCDHMIAAEPKIDILVSTAATFDWTDFFAASDEDWLRHFNVNVLSGVRLCRHYLADMLDRNWGRIVMVASESGLNIPADMIHYGVSKAAEIALARGLAELTAGSGVTVNSVLPGPTASSGSAAFLDNYAEIHGVPRAEAERHCVMAMRPTTLLQRFATEEEVANMIVYACSRQASATNGAAMRVEGGMLRHPG